MDNELMLDVGQANELKLAFRRAGFTNRDIKKLCEGRLLTDVLAVIHGTYRIIPISPGELKIFKTLKIARGSMATEVYRRVIEEAGGKISDWARELIIDAGFRTLCEDTEFDLVVLSVHELGFPEGATLHQIDNRAKEYGLAPCPPELGPELRVQYMDQPKEELLCIFMRPIANSRCQWSVFSVYHDPGGRWLHAEHASSGKEWRYQQRFVFVKPR